METIVNSIINAFNEMKKSKIYTNLTKNRFRGKIVYVIKGGNLCKTAIEEFLIV